MGIGGKSMNFKIKKTVSNIMIFVFLASIMLVSGASAEIVSLSKAASKVTSKIATLSAISSGTFITPYIKSADIKSIPTTFSISENCPWGYATHSIAFLPKNSKTSIRAVASGVITDIQSVQNENKLWNVIVIVKTSSSINTIYVFNTASKNKSDAIKQLARVNFKKGSKLKAGSIIGELLTKNKNSMFIFGVEKNNVFVSPEPYLSSAAKTSILAIVHKTHKTWLLAYNTPGSDSDSNKDPNKDNNGENNENEDKGLGMDVRDPLAKFTLSSPYKNESEIASIDWVYSEKRGGQPWGKGKSDMKFVPKVDLAEFQSMEDGVVEDIYEGISEAVEYHKIVRVSIRLDSKYVMIYTFNPSGTYPSFLETQRKQIFVSVGQNIKKGDIIGKLYKLNTHSNVLVALARMDEASSSTSYKDILKLEYVSPEPYFDKDTTASLLGLINKGRSGYKLGYYSIIPNFKDVTFFKDNALITFDKTPVVKNKELLLTFASLNKVFGFEATYNSQTKGINVRYGPNSIYMKVADTNAKVNGVSIKMNVAAQLVNGILYVPIKPILDAMRLSSSWDYGSKVFDMIYKECGGEVNRIVKLYDASPNSFHYSMFTIHKNNLFIGTTDFEGNENKTNKIIKMDLDLNKIWEYELEGCDVKGSASFDSKENMYITVMEKLNIMDDEDPSGKNMLTKIYLYSLTGEGKFRWRKEISNSWEYLSFGGNVNCTVDKYDTIYVADSKFFAFDTDGNIKWSYPAVGEKEIMPSRTAPLIDDNGNVFFFAPDLDYMEFDGRLQKTSSVARVYCFKSGSIKAGSIKAGSTTPEWTTGVTNGFEPSALSSALGATSAAFTKNQKNIVFIYGDTVCNISASDGSLNWKLKPYDGLQGSFIASPVLDNQDNVYCNTKCDDSSTLYAIKADGSGLLWANNDIASDLYCTAAIGDDDTIYIGSEPQIETPYTFNAVDIKTGKIKWQLGAMNIMGFCNATNVLIVDGYAYVANNAQHLAMIVKIKIDANGYQSGAAWPCFRGSNGEGY